jgi:hypothetical protein
VAGLVPNSQPGGPGTLVSGLPYLSCVTYSSETWILKETIINNLLVFGRKILRKIFGPNYENGIWRIKTNQELDEIIKCKNIINFIRAQRLSWLVTLKGCKVQEW